MRRKTAKRKAPPPARDEFPDELTFFDAASDYALNVLGNTAFALHLFIVLDIEAALNTYTQEREY